MPPKILFNGREVTRHELAEILDESLGDADMRVASGRPLRKNRICAACSRGYGHNPPFPKDGKRCGGCLNISYCDRKCQAAHWGVHKGQCKQFAAARAEYDSRANNGS